MKNIAMRFTALGFLLLGLPVHAATPEKIVVGYFSTQSREHFEKEIKPLFEEFKGDCKNCEILNLTPYDAQGTYDEKALADKIKNPPSPVSFYFFDWNKKVTDQNRPVVNALNEKIAAGTLVVAQTGQATTGEPGSPLSATVMGQTKDAVIIGETIGRERLLPQSYFGPEMLTAIYAPKDHQEKGAGPLYFVARWSGVYNKREPQEWLSHFRMKKAKSRKIFLDTNDLLGR